MVLLDLQHVVKLLGYISLQQTDHPSNVLKLDGWESPSPLDQQVVKLPFFIFGVRQFGA